MQPAARSYVMAAAALAATGGLVGVTPMPPREPAIHIASPAVRLVDAEDSILNIPANLFQDIVNIPFNEVEAFNGLGDAQLFAGTWLTSSATNLWGEDPGDPTRFQSLVEMGIPFTAISGEGQPEVGDVAAGWDQADINEAANGTLPLAQQITLLLDAEIPVSASSDADWSAPLIPVTTITGDTGIDRAIWTAMIFTDQQQFPLIDNWLQTPLSDLTSGTFNFGNVVDPSDGVGPGGSVPGEFGWAGTIPGPDGENLMPWSNLTFQFNPVSPFENFFTSLEAPVGPSTYASGFEIPTFDQIFQSFETNLAGLVVAFDPFVPGSFLCSENCDVPSFLTPDGILGELNTAFPGDSDIQTWLTNFNTTTTDEFGQPNPFGLDNGPTQEQINAISWLESGFQQQYDFGNPSPSDPPSTVNTPISFPESQEIQNLIALAQQNIIPGVDFPGTTGSSIQDFFQWQADSSGYVPIDFNSTEWLTSLPPASVELGSVATLLSDLGLGSLIPLF